MLTEKLLLTENFCLIKQEAKQRQYPIKCFTKSEHSVSCISAAYYGLSLYWKIQEFKNQLRTSKAGVHKI